MFTQEYTDRHRKVHTRSSSITSLEFGKKVYNRTYVLIKVAVMFHFHELNFVNIILY